MTTMDAASWLQLLGLGALMGAVGQGARVVVGVKKLQDAASASTATLGSLIDPSRMVISLAIGAIAGVLAAVSVSIDMARIGPSELLGFAAAGYAGADFIEGLISRVAPAPGAPAGEAAVGTGGAAPADLSAADGSVG